MEKKKLSSLKVTSFTTSFTYENINTVKGGGKTDIACGFVEDSLGGPPCGTMAATACYC